MQRCHNIKKISEEEIIKESGLVLDYDEIARKGSMSREEGLILFWFFKLEISDEKCVSCDIRISILNA